MPFRIRTGVIGPPSSGSGNIAVFDGDSGKALTDSGEKPADFAKPSDVTFENLDVNGDIGSESNQVAAGDHVHDDLAPKESPGLTGVPTTPTAAAGTNTDQIASCAYVETAILRNMGGIPV